MSKNQVQDGRVLTFLDSQLVKPTHTDGFAHNGDPVVVGTLVGVVVDDSLLAGGSADVSTEGVFNLSVLAKHAGAVNDAVAGGDQIYIDGATAVLSKDATKIPFGKALGTVGAGLTATIPVMIIQPGALAALTQSGPATDGVTHAVANGAIAIASGTVGLGSGGALAMTLADPANPGDDGKLIFIVAETAHAHTVTTSANKVKNTNASGDTLTFAHQGDSVLLEVIAGLYYVRAINGVVLSEV
jgi:predicted RecA/RadA family phage recombinase